MVLEHKKGQQIGGRKLSRISFLSVVGKVVDSMFVTCLTSYLEIQHLFNAKQFDLRNARSAADLTLVL